jgi:hypothetical protein
MKMKCLRPAGRARFLVAPVTRAASMAVAEDVTRSVATFAPTSLLSVAHNILSAYLKNGGTLEKGRSDGEPCLDPHHSAL